MTRRSCLLLLQSPELADAFFSFVDQQGEFCLIFLGAFVNFVGACKLLIELLRGVDDGVRHTSALMIVGKSNKFGEEGVVES